MEYVEKKIFSVSVGIFGFLFTEMLIEYSSRFPNTFVQIAGFDWLPGQQKSELSQQC